MTDPFSLTLLALTVGVGAAAGWLSAPRRPDLDGERVFKLAMATLLLGEVEAEGGDARAWEDRCRTWVPYHPAGRLPEDKLVHPEHFRPPGPALDGEIGLVHELEKLDSVPKRARWMYQEAELGVEARLANPDELGEAWELARWIAPEATWEALATWSAGDRRVADAIERRLGARWLVTEGVLSAALVDELDATVVAPDTLVQTADAVAPDRSDRLVLVIEGDAGIEVLDILRAQPGLRDRLLAVVAVGVPLWGRAEGEGGLSEGARRDWMDAHFRHETLDTEASRLTPYCAVQWMDLDAEVPGTADLGLGQQRFGPPMGREDALRIESVDLGPVLVGADPVLLVRALAVAVAVLVLSKR